MKATNFLINLVIFTAGLGTGYFAGKKKFEKKADDEIESVKESLQNYYNNRKDIPAKPKVKVKIKEKANISNNKTINESEYVDYSAPYRGTNEKPIKSADKEEYISEESKRKCEIPKYILDETEFGSSEYEAVSLYFFADNVLADDDFNIINNIENFLGDEAADILLNHKCDDSLFVRDDNLKVDYEVIIDERTYSNRYVNTGNTNNSDI